MHIIPITKKERNQTIRNIWKTIRLKDLERIIELIIDLEHERQRMSPCGQESYDSIIKIISESGRKK